MLHLAVDGVTPASARTPDFNDLQTRRRFEFDSGNHEPVLPWRSLEAILDELEDGIVLLPEGGTEHVHANHSARMLLQGEHPLRLCGRALTPRLAADSGPLRKAISEACRHGISNLIVIGSLGKRTPVAIVPLRVTHQPPYGALVLLGKQATCQSLSLAGFCRAHGLTEAEAEVLAMLVAGLSPKEIASQRDVKLATIRTHIATIRAKTGAPNVRALLRTTAVLPSFKPVLRNAA